MQSPSKVLALVCSLLLLIGMAACDNGEEQADESAQQQEQADEAAPQQEKADEAVPQERFERVKIQSKTIKEVDPERGVIVAPGMLGPKTEHWVTAETEMTRGGEAIGVEDLEAGQEITFQFSSGNERFELTSLEVLDEEADDADSPKAAADDQAPNAGDQE